LFYLKSALRSRFWLPGYGSAKIFESKPKTAKNNFLLKPKSDKRDDKNFLISEI